MNIRTVCETMTQAGVAPIDAFAQVVKNAQGSQCMDNSYADYLVQLRSTVADKGAGGLGLRQWTWQTCAQFAFYQTCGGLPKQTLNCAPHGRTLTVNFDTPRQPQFRAT
jgi:serine protease 16